jgi:hypothetical protein
VEKRFLLPGLDVNFSAPIDLSVPRMNWTKLQKLSDLTYHKLPELNDILNIPHLAPHNAYTIWVLVGAITLIIGTVLVVILVKYRSVIKKCCTKKLKKRPVATVVRYTAATDNGAWPTAPTVTLQEETGIEKSNVSGRTDNLRQQISDLYPKMSEFSQ